MIASVRDLTAVVVRALDEAIGCETPDGWCADCDRCDGLCGTHKAGYVAAEEYREARYLLTGQPAAPAVKAEVA